MRGGEQEERWRQPEGHALHALLPRLAWRRHAAPRRLHSAAPHRSLPIAFCPAQVSYTFHAFETFSPEHSCPTCTLDDTLTVLNRWGGGRAGGDF